MHLTSEERRIHQSHEDAREREACGEEPEVACCECEADAGGDRQEPHLIEGLAYCTPCALKECVRILGLDGSDVERRGAARLEVLEVIGAAAGELESDLRAAIRAGKAA